MRLARFLLILMMIQGCSTLSRGVSPLPAPKITSPSTQPTGKQIIVGEASWYGPGFNGKTTASGGLFDETKMTAAHKTLPLGSKAKVTNLQNGKSVEVEINDRGPYREGRIIDLSHAAAKALGIGDNGIARVSVEPLGNSVATENTKAQ
jgi:peptidoglycan lytic transglycosylase